jgi:UDP-N-acetylglucosamine 4,6-dehydratase
MTVAQDQGRYYRVPPDNRDLNYSVFESTGEPRISEASDYNSHSTERLDRQSMADILRGLDYIKRILAGERPKGDE